ncbi:hypothetical protein GDO81_005687 [Engystomops pustulosus]|uniref:Uncharacterized protein n=1 Tax=Engystomops pustulosus TaxID=76066 RepID=A0AAV7CQY7_ENGPU|nr:hypothetical protein GDO81_005687 [Engystomops pustulosus]
MHLNRNVNASVEFILTNTKGVFSHSISLCSNYSLYDPSLRSFVQFVPNLLGVSGIYRMDRKTASFGPAPRKKLTFLSFERKTTFLQHIELHSTLISIFYCHTVP